MAGKRKKPPEREQKRLTVRLPEELDKLLREEAVKRGTNINQTMLSILVQQFRHEYLHNP